MKPFSTILLVVFLSACSVNDDTPGEVYDVEQGSVKILGPKKIGRTAEPTKRMIAQAQEVCPGARYHSSQPSTVEFSTYEYTFRC